MISPLPIIYLRVFIAAVWLVNGLFCKLLNMVPRHQLIVGEILGAEFAPILTKIIGISEILMAIWVLSGIKPSMNATLQITIIVAMNILEFLLVPELLLWGRLNSLFALVFVGIIAATEYYRTQMIKA